MLVAKTDIGDTVVLTARPALVSCMNNFFIIGYSHSPKAPQCPAGMFLVIKNSNSPSGMKNIWAQKEFVDNPTHSEPPTMVCFGTMESCVVNITMVTLHTEPRK